MKRRILDLPPAWAIALGSVCIGLGSVVIFATPSEESPWLEALGTMTVFLGAWLIRGAVQDLRTRRPAPSEGERK